MGRPQFTALNESLSQAAERDDATTSQYGTVQDLAAGASTNVTLYDNSEGTEPVYIVNADAAMAAGTFSNDVILSLTVKDYDTDDTRFKSTRNPPSGFWGFDRDIKVPPGYQATIVIFNSSGAAVNVDVNGTYRTE